VQRSCEHLVETRDGASALLACVWLPTGVAVDVSAGRDSTPVVLFADATRLRRVDANGIISTVAGSYGLPPGACAPMTGGSSLAACWSSLQGVALDANGAVYVTSVADFAVYRVHIASGTFELFAGGREGTCGDGGPAAAACLSFPLSVLALGSGEVLITDGGVRVVAPNGTISTWLPASASGQCPDGVARAGTCASNVRSLKQGADGGVVFVDGPIVRAWAPQTDAVTWLAGFQPGDVACAAPNEARCWQLPVAAATVATRGGPPSVAVADMVAADIRIVTPAGGAALVRVLAGRTAPSYAGIGGVSTAASLTSPVGVAVAHGGAGILIADAGDRAVKLAGLTDAPTMSVAYAGRGPCPAGALAGGLNCAATVSAVAVHPSTGAVWFSEDGSHRVRVALNATAAATVAGGRSDPLGSFCGDGGPGALSCLASPQGLAFNATSGDVWMADAWNHRLRVVRSTDGVIFTAVGDGNEGFCPDGLLGPATCLMRPFAVAFDAHGRVYFTDDTARVRSLLSVTSVVVTVAGVSGGAGYCGDGGPATAACLLPPLGVAVDSQQTLWIADGGNARIRVVDLAGNISTMSGSTQATSGGDAGDGLGPGSARWLRPTALVFDSWGNVIVADAGLGRVRAIAMSAGSIGCPAGFSCACGTPAICGDPATFCKPNMRAPMPVSGGSYSTPEALAPSAAAVTGAVAARTGQATCPPGSYCSGGQRYPCPPGTQNPEPGQVSPQACLVCPAGTYSPVASSPSTSSCLPCPPGSTANATGSPYCKLCPAGSQWSPSTGTCVWCAAGTFSLPGSTSCVLTPPASNFTSWDSFVSLKPITQQQGALVPPDAVQSVVFASAMPVFVVFALPLVILVVAHWWTPCPAVQTRFNQALRTVDAFGLTHFVHEGEAPVKRTSTFGGGVTLLAFGTMAALAIALTVQFAIANGERVPPIMAPVADEFAGLDVARLPSPVSVGSFSIGSGLTVQVVALGPLCGTTAWQSLNLLGLTGFTHAASFNTSTGLAVHTFACDSCAFTPSSTLDLTLHPSCQALTLHAAAVSTAGTLSIASYTIDPPAPAVIPPAAVAVTFALTLDVEVDSAGATASGGGGPQRRRGISVTPEPAFSPPSSDPSVLLLRINLPIAPAFVNRQLRTVTTPTQLASSIIGLSGLLSGFGVLLARIERLRCGPSRTRRVTRTTLSGRAAGAHWAAVSEWRLSTSEGGASVGVEEGESGLSKVDHRASLHAPHVLAHPIMHMERYLPSTGAGTTSAGRSGHDTASTSADSPSVNPLAQLPSAGSGSGRNGPRLGTGVQGAPAPHPPVTLGLGSMAGEVPVTSVFRR